MNIKISVVTVTFNAVNTLEETILSVINQKYANKEYILIDGVSTDGTINLISNYSKSITYFESKPDAGIYDAMNKALDIATGDFVIFLGADDHFISYDILDRVVEYMKNLETIYYGDVIRNSRNDIYCGKFNKYKLSMVNICHQAIFYPKKIYSTQKYEIHYRVYADYYYNLIAYKKCKFVYLPMTITYYNCAGYSSAMMDAEFDKVVNKFIYKYLGILPYIVGVLFKLWKKI